MNYGIDRNFTYRIGESEISKVIAVAPLLSEFNEFNNLFAGALQDAGARAVDYKGGLRSLSQCDAVIFHWPDQFMRPDDWRVAVNQLARIHILKRTHGLKVVWLAHNIHPHDADQRATMIQSAFINALDGIIYLSRKSQRLVHEAYRLPRGIVQQVTVHGRYPAPPLSFQPPADQERVQLVSVGLVRPYKNLTELVKATADLEPSQIEVAVVGKRHDAAYSATLEASAAGKPALRLQLSDSLIRQSELNEVIDRAHGVVLPYRKILNSGSAVLALSRARPVLVPATGSMPELADLVGHDWVRLYEGEITGAVLARFADHLKSIPAGAAPDLSCLSWDRVTDDLRAFFSSLFGTRRTRAYQGKKAG